MNKPILCVDFDGVIHSYTSGWKGELTIADPPVPGVFEWLESLIPHFEINIYSSRSKYGKEAVDAMFKWFVDNDASPELLMELEFPLQKPAAYLTIDDRAICFDGNNFPTIQEMTEFNPWNKSTEATELEWLRYFWKNVDFGPAHEDIVYIMQQNFGIDRVPKKYRYED